MVVHRSVLHKHVTGGGSKMKTAGKFDEPIIVETYQYGDTTVRIASNAFVKTPEEKEKVIRDMHMAGWTILEEIYQKQTG